MEFFFVKMSGGYLFVFLYKIKILIHLSFFYCTVYLIIF
jgi:hypothetical protein